MPHLVPKSDAQSSNESYSAFDGPSLVAHGPITEIIPLLKKRMGKSHHTNSLIFSDKTGNTLDFNFQGTEKEVLKRIDIYITTESTPTGGAGRPKLGVVSREISLLPRQWEWLASQSGGASGVLRGLVDEAKKKAMEGNGIKQAQEKTYRFMSVMAGDLKGYEEALRALYKKDEKNFLAHTVEWPADVRTHLMKLSKGVWG